MNVIVGLKEINRNKKRGVALGNFDGVHIGHQQLISTLVDKSREGKLESSVYTFRNHPLAYVSKGEGPPLITSIEVKTKILEEFNVETLILDEFNEEIMSLSPEDFIKEILVNKLNCKVAIVGFDYRFGYKAQGDVKLLKDLGKKYEIEVFEIDPVVLYNEKVSSSSIRKYIWDGKIDLANEFLGRYYSLYSRVVHGMGRGKFLGYPTANSLIEPFHLIPKEGVYATFVIVGGKTYMGATCVGTNPTFNGKNTTVETFIIDYKGSLYDQFIEIKFVMRIRDNVKFENVDDLVEQMMLDVENAKKYLQGKQTMLK
ncbi:bifunctional riboflavin kinase/FAD synthetase [Alkaliphilus peptidifermentans]|uniref:Riboflavin biosynthesis protein n=1 Tax=Alkaliphilus peptidifermentans DSM 18978 TaxID=1120976 RepID=A0A1G5DCL7_9FIRM|nr:bifunctional riboflavin kinase/FAD synthetase [Alkaliphilus peptidifermentans]SCY12271.1 FMN adenylyltransferase [Alkaliphilus peptidifermentans DSM 18978]